ncbi:hypothetical protein J2T57_003899 [Natronocella acetinitrilica]|uniref:Scaffold protein FimL second domain-containing protein n=1 Tax=Natronocella acetinitrilica TaxID=414046 RepID=A0AAE3KDU5_9GAMM|nr:hypothetical protein [Natronocella acetinitrilica]MCP1676728.1 hypothetical protein [Natronocella acetinitrilica]
MTIRPIATPVHIAQSEIHRGLEAAAASLEASAESDGADASFAACRGMVAEVRGALRMLEMEGAAELAAECELLLEALDAGSSLSRDKALDALLYALLLLPRYIDRVAAQKRELPDILLPTLNTLRGLRRSPPLPAYHFARLADLGGDLALLSEPDRQCADGDELKGLLRRLRHMLQVGLLGLFRDPAAGVHAKQVHRALKRLGDELGDTQSARWLRLSAALLDQVVAGDLPVDHSLRMLLSRLDLHLRAVSREGAASLASAPPPEVRTGLLFYAVAAGERDETIRRLRETLGLKRLVTPPSLIEHEREALAAPSPAVLGAVSSALQEEMERLKDTIETLGRLGSVTDTERLDICEQLGRLGSTLNLIGVSDAAALLKREHTRLQSVESSAAPDRVLELLDQMADALTEAEESVRGLDDVVISGSRDGRKPRQLRQAEHQAVAEAMANMERVRQSMEYLNGDLDEGEHPATVDGAMVETVGTLRLIGHGGVADLIERCRLQMQKLSDNAAGSATLSSLADALAALEWYLEGLLEGVGFGEETLELAEEVLRELEADGVEAVKPIPEPETP